MKYELKIKNENSIQIKKTMAVPLWSSSQLFEEIEPLKKYMIDFLKLKTPITTIETLLNSAAMDSWVEFE